LGPIRTRSNTLAFGSENFFENFFWVSICIAHAHRLRCQFLSFAFYFDPQTAAFRLSTTPFFAIFGAAVFIVGALPGSFSIQFLGNQAALITAEDLGGMIGRKSPIAGLEQATALG
jgi:hypothetical protein